VLATETHVDRELRTQPQLWREAAGLVPQHRAGLPTAGASLAVLGSGTSWFISMSYAVLRERAGLGRTDAFATSEFPIARDYDHVLVICRSGTTTEAVDVLRGLSGRIPTTVVTAVPDSPAAEAADQVIGLPFADEESVVQTRFATTTLALLRAHLGTDIEPVARDAETAMKIDVSPLLSAQQCSFLGRGWTVGLAQEAALKSREAAQFWAEAYPAMDYRHGPIAIAEPGRLVWALGDVPPGLEDEVTARGATWVHHELDAMAALVVAQRFAVELALSRGLDPDHPRALTRAVVLE
jgi:fructoselysine-6-P-deglycase FrlB-like protein